MIKKIFLISLLNFINFSFSLSPQKNVENEEEVSFNNEGLLNGISVTNIKIDDDQEKIKFYLIPDDEKKDPKDSFVYLSLIPSKLNKTHIKSIKLANSIDGKEKIEIKFNNENYVKVIVTLNSNEGEGISRIYLLKANSVISSIEKSEIKVKYVVKVTALISLEILNFNKK